MMLLLLLTTLNSAPQEATPPRPPVISIPVLACTEATLTALLVVSGACFPERAVDMLPIPATDSAPPTVTDELSSAAPSQCSSRVHETSRPWMSALVVRLATFNALLVVSAACFAAMVDAMSTPAKYSGPASIMLDPIMAEPATSIDGALTGAVNTALPAEMPSRSTPFESARLNVPDAGFTRAHVSSDSCSADEDVSNPLFESKAA